MSYMSELFQMEHFSRDSFRVKRVYVDAAEDLIAGILLGQIIYWNLPNEHGKSKLRVVKKNQLWLAKGRSDWWDEIRITPKQFDRAIKILKEKNFVQVEKFKFNGAPTLHIKLNLPVVTQAVNSILTKGENPNAPKGEMELDQRVNSLTEITTEITTETTADVKQQQNAFNFYQQNIGQVSGHVAQELMYEVSDMGDELVIEAIKKAVDNNVRTWNYCKRILKEWRNKNIKSLQDVEAEQVEWENKRYRKKEKVETPQYESNSVSSDELFKFL